MQGHDLRIEDSLSKLEKTRRKNQPTPPPGFWPYKTLLGFLAARTVRKTLVLFKVTLFLVIYDSSNRQLIPGM